MRLTLLAGAVILAGAVALAQSPAFEAVSIKPSGTNSGAPPSAPDRYYKPAASLTSLIGDAYGYPKSRIVGAPEWNDATTFEVSAKASAPMTADTQKLLLQQMLAERFALRTHVEA